MADKIGSVSSIANIPAGSIRDTLRSTMVLGLPETVVDRPTFYWDKAVTFAEHDADDKPWDWTVAPTLDTTPTPEQVICAYEFAAPFGRTGAVPERAGEFNMSTVVVTCFEDEYAMLSGVTNGAGGGFSYVTIGPELDRRWYFRYWQPSLGLGSLTTYQITCGAEDT